MSLVIKFNGNLSARNLGRACSFRPLIIVTSLLSVVLIDACTDESTISSLRTSIVKRTITRTGSENHTSANPSHAAAVCALDPSLFLSAFEPGSAEAYLVETEYHTTPVVLKILTEMYFLLPTDEEMEMFSFRARIVKYMAL